MESTEQVIVQQIQNKNEQAISLIIQQYGGLLTTIIKRHLPIQQQDAEECLDDVLLSIWDNISSFDPEKNSLKQWMAAIAKYKAIDYQRRQMARQKKQVSITDIQESKLQATSSRESIIREDVEELLEQLSVNERKIFEKYYIEGTPSREIAREFQAKESWIYNKLSRGRKKLKHFLILKNKA